MNPHFPNPLSMAYNSQFCLPRALARIAILAGEVGCQFFKRSHQFSVEPAVSLVRLWLNGEHSASALQQFIVAASLNDFVESVDRYILVCLEVKVNAHLIALSPYTVAKQIDFERRVCLLNVVTVHDCSSYFVFLAFFNCSRNFGYVQ